jgi:hypothetical protein
VKYILVALALGAVLVIFMQAGFAALESGMHSNFSTTYTRETGGEKYINALLDGFAPHHAEHMAEYSAITNNG